MKRRRVIIVMICLIAIGVTRTHPLTAGALAIAVVGLMGRYGL